MTDEEMKELEALRAEKHSREQTERARNALTAAGIPARLAPPNLRTQSAWGVARLALEQARAGQLLTPNQLVPVYHRLSQAERERLEREQAAKRET